MSSKTVEFEEKARGEERDNAPVEKSLSRCS